MKKQFCRLTFCYIFNSDKTEGDLNEIDLQASSSSVSVDSLEDRRQRDQKSINSDSLASGQKSSKRAIPGSKRERFGKETRRALHKLRGRPSSADIVNLLNSSRPEGPVAEGKVHVVRRCVAASPPEDNGTVLMSPKYTDVIEVFGFFDDPY